MTARVGWAQIFRDDLTTEDDVSESDVGGDDDSFGKDFRQRAHGDIEARRRSLAGQLFPSTDADDDTHDDDVDADSDDGDDE